MESTIPSVSELSSVAEQWCRRLAQRLGHAMLLRKRELHRLVEFRPVERIHRRGQPTSWILVAGLFGNARSEEAEAG